MLSPRKEHLRRSVVLTSLASTCDVLRLKLKRKVDTFLYVESMITTLGRAFHGKVGMLTSFS